MGVMVSKEFAEFFQKVKNLGNELDMEEMCMTIRENIKPIADKMHLGKFTSFFRAPESTLDVNGVEKHLVLHHSSNGFEEERKEFYYQTGGGGRFEVNCYPEKGHVWTSEELEALEFLADQIFILTGRIRLLGLINKFAVTDMGTGASNMKGFVAHCEKLYREKRFQEYDVMFLNMKNFKFINRLAGEGHGDDIIRRYAHRLMKYVSGDELVARPGGDNYVVLIRKEHEEDFLDFISNASFTVNVLEEKQTVRLIARVGIFAVGENDTVTKAMDGAGAALNMAKKNGIHDVVRFASDVLEKTIRANEISTIFPEALKNKEFVVYYQPKVSLSENRLCGCEALARWANGKKVVSPAEFVPVLESEGSICSLDFYVLNAVCADIKRWISLGMNPVRVSTNFSKIHLHNINFAEEIVETIRKHGIDTKYIEIELTESSGYDDYDALAEFVRKMKSYGVSTSIDDFGTGYSSLNMLKDLDVDIIKLDKSFLDNLDSGEHESEVVIRHIINMVNELKMRVVAEGVENYKQVEMLENMKCSMAQGYLFDKPLTREEFESRLNGERIYSE